MQAFHRVPKLTRAAFVLIASTISTIDFDSSADRDRVIADFTNALRPTNPNFKSQRFIDACQPLGGSEGSVIKTEKLSVRCYARHGDTCSIAPHCESLGCASGCKPNDLVLVAQFAYLQEAIDYCQEGARRGVSMRLISRICPIPYVSNYVPNGRAA
jgi:hypothetical protein